MTEERLHQLVGQLFVLPEDQTEVTMQREEVLELLREVLRWRAGLEALRPAP